MVPNKTLNASKRICMRTFIYVHNISFFKKWQFIKKEPPIFEQLNNNSYKQSSDTLANKYWSSLNSSYAEDGYNKTIGNTNNVILYFAPKKLIKIRPRYVMRESWITPEISHSLRHWINFTKTKWVKKRQHMNILIYNL